MRIQVIFGILLIFTQAAMGLLFQDPVVCRFSESSQCYVALGQRLHLQMPLEDGFELKITDKTSTTRLILRYRKTQSNPPKPNHPRWQFVKDNKTMILTSAERSDSGTYTLDTFDANGNNKGSYTLQLTTEGLLFQDPVVCRFNESRQCYVALGERLHLQMPLEDGFELKITDKTSTDRFILKYRKTQSNPPKPSHPRWQFVKDYKTMILTSAERNDSGTYTLDTFDANGNNKGIYSLQLNIEAMVSSVKVWYSCLCAEVRKAHCSADGDNLRFIWTADLSTLTQLGTAHSTFLLDKNHQGNITCNIENHVSHDRKTIELHPCSDPEAV
ncbi:uncharacterized protein LOC128635436 [Ictalurus punctatus]|uniref:Uncharacterized protein LOC128635436 n=1 Tax=Ictalurus punctatus TaxID=7998 RepID=A0A9F7RVH4_ICTPU|nr:uncharacterized protein LOC128635436 [Ictalurus punctatus]